MPVEPLWFGLAELSSAQHWFKALIDKTGYLAKSRAAQTLGDIDLDIEAIFDGHDQVEDVEAVKADFVNAGIGGEHYALWSVSLSKLNNLFEYGCHDIPLAVSRGHHAMFLPHSSSAFSGWTNYFSLGAGSAF